MEYIATKNICVKGGFVKEGEIVRLEPEEASVYLDEGMIDFLPATDENKEDEADD
ncbi:hypothetical protein CCAL9344_01295 [Campylobacter sp. RM9344]|uniref:Uncharacterized protein n=1 Tax=Campylobacter californiensis TaxID=1032243 RepID=A0AAW3ZQD4_9BACT|nr:MULTISPECIES: hypothetical protein [unclassified Campylobacter]MBE2984651.1 hypothetical protein [Campylobacter sp. RM6883]MBE2994567.1 hypothetical protein [Campylobacter sp. RM6913]MBE3028834.1 hypothetical protein [Campylobacter sp. RM9344]MBE3607192.1 hypothetical protein [Campylobacter sp. RM9337]MBE3609508.1 hypothetical protein [Campylobacter sp. RM12916]